VSNQAVIGVYYFREPDLVSAIRKQWSAMSRLRGNYYLADALQIMIDGWRPNRVAACRRVGGLRQARDGAANQPVSAQQDGRLLRLRYGRDDLIPPVYIADTAGSSGRSLAPHVNDRPRMRLCATRSFGLDHQ